MSRASSSATGLVIGAAAAALIATWLVHRARLSGAQVSRPLEPSEQPEGWGQA